MNCLYCQKLTECHTYKLNGNNRIFYACSSCDTHFIVNDIGAHIKTNIWFNLHNKNFVFGIDVINQICILNDRDRNSPHNQSYYFEEFRLSHIPDWTPQNIAQKVSHYIIFS